MSKKMKRAPFCCGTEGWDWFANNCERCARYGTDDNITCEHAENILASAFGDGKVPEETYNIIDIKNFNCKLYEPVPEMIEYQMIADKLKNIFKRCYYMRNNRVNAIICHHDKEDYKKYYQFAYLIRQTNLDVEFSMEPETETIWIASDYKVTKPTGDILYIADIKGLKNQNTNNDSIP